MNTASARQHLADTITTLIMEQVTEAEATILLADPTKVSQMIEQLRAAAKTAAPPKDVGTFTFRLCGVRLHWPPPKKER